MRLIDADAMLKRNKNSIYDTTDLEEMLDCEPTAQHIGVVWRRTQNDQKITKRRNDDYLL